MQFGGDELPLGGVGMDEKVELEAPNSVKNGAGRRKGGAPPYKRCGRGESLVGRLSLNESCWRVPVHRSFWFWSGRVVEPC